MADIDRQGDKHIVLKLLGLALVMFGFAVWVMPPFYYALCDLLDIDPRTNSKPYEAEPVQVDRSRTVKVQFVAINSAGMSWDFHPNEVRLEANPGQVVRTSFYARNPAKYKTVGQAVPSIVPTKAAEYFHKTECFCFNQQILEAGEAVDMPLVFVIDQALPPDVHTITLSYTLFDVTQAQKPDATPAPDLNRTAPTGANSK